jgi:hypothetical protein
VCGRTATEPIAATADDVLEYFLETLHKHYENADGNAPFDHEEDRFCAETWDIYDLLFGELGDIAEPDTLKWLHGRLKDGVTYCRRDWQIMSPGEALTSAWERFCHAVKHETRFLFFANDADDDDGEPYRVRPAEMLDELGDVIRSCGLTRSLSSGTRMFRVRGHENGKAFTAPVDVGPPPAKYATTAGRMNAPGIVVMYASFDRNTARDEATGNRTEFSVAEFELLKELRVVDLTNIPRVPTIFEGGPREYLQFLKRFVDDVSQPFTPDAAVHVEYTPTQVVSEFLRHRFRDSDGNPIRGLLYRSAKENGSINLALFVDSEELEGVPSEPWRRKQHVLRLTRIDEVIQGAQDADSPDPSPSNVS